jgi:hypothetical protein
MPAAFGKGRLCRDLTEPEATELLAAAQAAAWEIKPPALGAVGAAGFDEAKFDGYAHGVGTFEHGSHRPKATIPFIVEAWAFVTNRKGHKVVIDVLANRTPIVEDVIARRAYKSDVIVLSGAGLGHNEVKVKGGDCSIVLHVTSPLIPILSIGKRPNLSVFQPDISEAIRLAFNRSRDKLAPDPEQPKAPPVPKPNKAEPKAPVIFIPRVRLGGVSKVR